MTRRRHALTALTALALVATARPARAQSIDADAAELEEARRESIATRRALARAVLVAGIGSAVGGGVLIVPDAEDQAFRYAGINTAAFGVINTIVALVALHGIAKEEDTWNAAGAAAARRTPEGLARARVHAVLDERREATSHAINLGLDAGYLGLGGAAILASRLGVDHPSRWLGSGIAIGVQAVFLIGIDLVGMRRASHYHRVFTESLVPSVTVTPTSGGAAGSETRISVGGTF